jgi:uncharacterized membrane protein
MSDQDLPNQQNKKQLQESLLSQITVKFVHAFGSWSSVFIHTIFFVGWYYLGLDLEQLLSIVSLEAIFIGIFLLMAENIESKQNEFARQQERKRDMSVVKRDAAIDEEALKQLKQIRKQLNTLQNIINQSKQP